MGPHRLLAQLEDYRTRWPGEEAQVDRIREFLQRRPDGFERSCQEGHVTASAWVVSPDGGSVLLTRHRKLDMWLQLGGHADGDTDTAAVAAREVREESGLKAEAVEIEEPTAIFDVDVHEIPARPGEPAHLHYDIRYLLVADASRPLAVTEESDELAWIAIDDLAAYTCEESVARMARKARATGPPRV